MTWTTRYIFSKDTSSTDKVQRRDWRNTLGRTRREAKKQQAAGRIDLHEYEVDDNRQIEEALREVRPGDLLMVFLHGYIDDQGDWCWTHTSPEPGIPVTRLPGSIPCGAAILLPCTNPGEDAELGPDVMVPKLARAIGRDSTVVMAVGESRTADDALRCALLRKVAEAGIDDAAAAVTGRLDYFRPREVSFGAKRENWHLLRIHDAAPSADDYQAICQHWARLRYAGTT